MTRDSTPAAGSAGDADDDALSWAGEDDPTLSSSSAAEAAAQSSLAPGWKVVGEPGSSAGESSDGDAEAEALAQPEAQPDSTDSAAASSVALIVLGVLGGVYLLYTVGWAITAGRVASTSTDVIASFMFTLGLWLAAAGPALWFAVTLWLTADKPRWRLFWLVLGVIVLVPVPFVAGVGVGV